MEMKRVGRRGMLFTFYDLGIPTNVYVICGERYVYIVDTYLGPDAMDEINQYIAAWHGDKNIIVVNTHSHWDHVWGNCLYNNSPIISHVLCRELMEKEGQGELLKYEKYKRGEIEIVYPSLTITGRLYFEEDRVLIYHTPGHTEDGISAVDLADGVLYAGDNLERPIPYITSKDLKQYREVLEEYLDLEIDIVIGGHTRCEDKALIRDNLNYIRRLEASDTEDFEAGEYADIHKGNMKTLME